MTDLGDVVTWVLIVVASISSLWWGRQYRAAKEAEIRSLKTQIELLNQLNPESLRDRVVATRELLEQSHGVLVEDLRRQISGKDARLAEARVTAEEGTKLREERDELERQVGLLRLRLTESDKALSDWESWIDDLARTIPGARVRRTVTFSGVAGRRDSVSLELLGPERPKPPAT
jgi:chromosome segregation ATPase